jgi:hypothetical protein
MVSKVAVRNIERLGVHLCGLACVSPGFHSQHCRNKTKQSKTNQTKTDPWISGSPDFKELRLQTLKIIVLLKSSHSLENLKRSVLFLKIAFIFILVHLGLLFFF